MCTTASSVYSLVARFVERSTVLIRNVRLCSRYALIQRIHDHPNPRFSDHNDLLIAHAH